MPGKRKRHSAEFKAKVAVEAIRGITTAGELAGEYQAHPTLVSQWKRQAMDGMSTLFETPSRPWTRRRPHCTRRSGG